MIVTLALVAGLLSRAPATVHYEHLPLAITSVITYRESGSGGLVPIRREPLGGDGSISVTMECAGTVVVMFVRPDGVYLLDGPFAWPREEQIVRTVAPVWRHTISAATPREPSAVTAMTWLPVSGDSGPEWPRCIADDWGRWRCLGVPMNARGVLMADLHGTLLSGVSGTSAVVSMRTAAWGRLVRARSASGGSLSRIQVGVEYPVAPPAARSRAFRWDTTAVAGTLVTSIGRDAAWVSGPEPPDDSWVRVGSPGHAPAFLPLKDLISGDPMSPMTVVLDEDRGLTGTVQGSDGAPASAALVTLFRFIDPPTSAPLRAPTARRVLLAETVTGDDGTFRFTAPGAVACEVVAWHSQMGRGAVTLTPGAESASITLQSAGAIIGRVISNGRPLEGVDIISAPDISAFSEAVDETVLKGGDARTGADGRFRVSVAERGGGELRIGGGRFAVRRVPLPAAAQPFLDLGDLELPSSIVVTVLVDRAPTCEVRAAGPLGRAGLQVVQADRQPDGSFMMSLPEPGAWAFSLACADGEHGVVPGVVPVDASMAGNEIRLSRR